jgi:hypothetical protein
MVNRYEEKQKWSLNYLKMATSAGKEQDSIKDKQKHDRYIFLI